MPSATATADLATSTIVLATALVSSAILISPSRPPKSEEANGYLPVSSGKGGKCDPFERLDESDEGEGVPVREKAFWSKTNLLELLLLLLLLTPLPILQALTLGLSLPAPHTAFHLTSSLLLLLSYSFLPPLAFLLLRTRSPAKHWSILLHLSTLLAVALAARFALAVIPGRERPALLEWARVALLGVALIITVSVNAGPPVWHEPRYLHTPAPPAGQPLEDEPNVCGSASGSILDHLLFGYATPVVLLGYHKSQLSESDLPHLPASLRASVLFRRMRQALFRRPLSSSEARKPSGWPLLRKLFRVNLDLFWVQIVLAAVTALMYYLPAYFLQKLLVSLESTASHHPEPDARQFAWLYCAGLFASNVTVALLTGQLWSVSTTGLQGRMRVQLNSLLFAKTLMRKDISGVPSSSADGAEKAAGDGENKDGNDGDGEEEEEDVKSKSQIMTLMTVDVDRVAESGMHVFSLVDSPIEIVVGSVFLYSLLGSSAFWGLAVIVLFLPLNHLSGKYVVRAQDRLMSARDKRTSLMNEILQAIRMIKFQAWERKIEKRLLDIRAEELKQQRNNYLIEVAFNWLWEASPILVTIAAFLHFAVWRKQELTPAIAFTSISVFNEMKFALNALPETFINLLQTFVSLRRISVYLTTPDITSSSSALLDRSHSSEGGRIALRSASLTWPQQDAAATGSRAGTSVAPTPGTGNRFVLRDLTVELPVGELTLVCGKLGSGKSLFLLGLLGEADLVSGQLVSPRSSPDAMESFPNAKIRPEDWLLPDLVAYVPQAAWLMNASIKENILFSTPYDPVRYAKTLEVCALVSDLKIMEDGDETEIGERGLNLSGGQKQRVSLARAVYSRASTLLLDDVLSAVDSHTAHHIWNECLQGPLMEGRTCVLISHHVQLTAPGASYVIALDNGAAIFTGSGPDFLKSDVSASLVSTTTVEDDKDDPGKTDQERVDEAADPDAVVETHKTVRALAAAEEGNPPSETSAVTLAAAISEPPTPAPALPPAPEAAPRKTPRKLIEEETRAAGRVGSDVYFLLLKSMGGAFYWSAFVFLFLFAAVSPVLENYVLSWWSGSYSSTRSDEEPPNALRFLGIYAAVLLVGVFIATLRWLILYMGSISASHRLHKSMLESVLFAPLRFHDTVSRGRLLNRFGKDTEGIDSTLADNFGRTILNALSVVASIASVAWVGGRLAVFFVVVLLFVYYQVAKVYSTTSRDLRRIESVLKSPVYTLYAETISGVQVLRAFGASSLRMSQMLEKVDTATTPFYWLWSVNRWLSARFNILSAVLSGLTAVVIVAKGNVPASLAGFALSFAMTVSQNLLFAVRRLTGLEQSMVALERVKEYSELPSEPPEYVEPRPPAAWPFKGAISVENLSVAYAPSLPKVLHDVSFDVPAGAKVGIVGPTGCGKSTLALSFFRFVEAAEGRVAIDGVDIAKVGLTDLRSRLQIVPQDPTILSGTLRSTLDVFDEHDDAEIFAALRRVHLISPEDSEEAAVQEAEEAEGANANVFRNLDALVSEGGDNFSQGQKQLICMARAILIRSKVLLLDEATASVDYKTDELINKTIRNEFADSTILTIAHRLRSIIDFDRVLVMSAGRVAEYDRPAVLLRDTHSRFYALCRATGRAEFAVLKRMAFEAEAATQGRS